MENKNKIKGIIIVRERTNAAPKMIKINDFFVFFFKAMIVFIFLSALALAFGWSFVFQRLTTYHDMQVKTDSLILHSQQVDSLKINIVRINRYLEYFKMVSSIESKNGTTPPTIDEFLKDTALVMPQEFLDAQQQFRSIPKIRPVTGIISRGFDPSIPHNAIDFVAPRGTPVRATADGAVSRVFFDTDMGHVVVITHSYGYETLYAHCEKVLVSVGQNVVQGQTIALVGNTGGATRGYHLHYEVLRNGQPIDPKTLFL